jgi:hypothetical protein
MPRRHLSRRQFLSKAGMGIAWAVLGFPKPSLGQPSRQRFSVIYFTKFLRGLNPEEIARVVKGMGLDGLDLTIRRGHCVNPDNLDGQPGRGFAQSDGSLEKGGRVGADGFHRNELDRSQSSDGEAYLGGVRRRRYRQCQDRVLAVE